MKTRTVATFVLMFSASAIADSNIRYVTATGDNGNTGTNVLDAWATVQYGVDTLAAEGGANTLYVGAGVTDGNARISLDATNNAQEITIIGLGEGASLDNKTTPSTTTTQVIDVASGCNSGTFTFQNLAIAHSHTSNSYAVRMNNASATAVNLNFVNCDISSTHHGIGHLAAGTANYTLTGCTLTYAFAGFVASQIGSSVTFESTTANDGAGGTEVVRASGAVITSVIVRDGCQFYSDSDPIIDVGSNIATLTLADSTFTHNDSVEGAIIAYASGVTTVTGCTFTGSALTQANINLLEFNNGTGLTFSGNTVSGIPATSTTNQTCVRVLGNGAGDVAITGNTITSGCQGVYVAEGSGSAYDIDASNNTVTITANGATDYANGIVLGAISESPSNTWGNVTCNHNTVRHTGTQAGIGIMLGSQIRGAASEAAYNTILGQSSPSGGTQYGFYNLAHNLHQHHNNVYARSPCTHIGIQDGVIELNNFVARAGNSKGVCSLTYHAVFDPEDSIVRQNFFVALFDTASNYAVHVEGTPSNLFFDKNWYGIVGQSNVVLQNITSLTTAATLADAQARWNTLGGDSTGGDLNSLLDTYDVFIDPANGDFNYKPGVIDQLRSIGFPIGATDPGSSSGQNGVHYTGYSVNHSFTGESGVHYR